MALLRIHVIQTESLSRSIFSLKSSGVHLLNLLSLTSSFHAKRIAYLLLHEQESHMHRVVDGREEEDQQCLFGTGVSEIVDAVGVRRLAGKPTRIFPCQIFARSSCPCPDSRSDLIRDTLRSMIDIITHWYPRHSTHPHSCEHEHHRRLRF